MGRNGKPNCSERQIQALLFIEERVRQGSVAPTIREIGKEIQVSSTSQVNYYLNKLIERGLIEHVENCARSFKITSQGREFLNSYRGVREKPVVNIENVYSIPVLGQIVAGKPIPLPPSDFALFDPESTLEISEEELPCDPKDVRELFALRVTGDSMIDAMVMEGDTVVLRRTNLARNGDMVAAWLVDEQETTLKYFYAESGRIRLQPANRKMDPIIIERPANVQVQGKVVMVVRKVQERQP